MKMTIKVKTVFLLLTAVLVLTVSAGSAFAHGIIDQQNVFGPPYTTYAPVSGAVVGQSFVPATPSLTGVDLYIQNAAAIQPANLTVRLRQGPVACPSWLCVMATTTVSVPGGFAGWQHVDLAPLGSKIQLTPGQLYGVQVSSPSNQMRWFYSGNLYAPGMGFYSTGPNWLTGFQASYDGAFRTYQ